MIPHEPVAATGWRARLELGYALREGGTVLARRRHVGPLRVQKSFYPEGASACHSVVVHPPAGICGGDVLELDVELEPGARALLTTPGAAKWYRSAGAQAIQSVRFRVNAGATLEWLPRESIVFDGARCAMGADIALAPGARFIGWEILCLGRRASGEGFERGEARLATRIHAAGRLLWFERGRIDGGGAMLESPAGLAGAGICGTLLAAGAEIPAALLARCRELEPYAGRGGVTALPRLLVARYLGDEAEAAHEWFAALWGAIRPALLGREAVPPRIWRT